MSTSAQKLLSIAIPSYNSEAYMEHAIQSLLPGGDEVEILIVNDGSKDGTREIAERYEKQYPGLCKAVNKENGGHGDAVMTGLRNAHGIYFKVVDSDDWLDEEAYPNVLSALRSLSAREKQVDLKPMLEEFTMEGPALHLLMKAGSQSNIKPELIAEDLMNFHGLAFERDRIRITNKYFSGTKLN